MNTLNNSHRSINLRGKFPNIPWQDIEIDLMMSQPIFSKSESPNTDPRIALIRKKNLRLLIVDDDNGYRVAMKFNLTHKYNARVTVAESGDNAASILQNDDDFSGIFMDWMMPGTDGLDTYRKLTHLKLKSHKILMSAFNPGSKATEAQKLGIQFLPKPISEEKLIVILYEMCR